MRRRSVAALGSAIFFVLAPGTVAGLIPWWLSRWQLGPPLLGFTPIRGLGAMLVAAGLGVLLDSFVRFALHGRGTPSPTTPTERLVVRGLYRYVRNPMYVGVLATVVGQGLLLGNTSVLVYAAVLWLVFHLFVLFYEEPTLRARYGAEYESFRAAVPRWIPRLRPWNEAGSSIEG
jgi:protein-S-isoprenylcysteine O-methyltransferase Ste14